MTKLSYSDWKIALDKTLQVKHSKRVSSFNVTSGLLWGFWKRNLSPEAAADKLMARTSQYHRGNSPTLIVG